LSKNLLIYATQSRNDNHIKSTSYSYQPGVFRNDLRRVYSTVGWIIAIDNFEALTDSDIVCQELFYFILQILQVTYTANMSDIYENGF
jgi:hypothetical protein